MTVDSTLLGKCLSSIFSTKARDSSQILLIQTLNETHIKDSAVSNVDVVVSGENYYDIIITRRVLYIVMSATPLSGPVRVIQQ